MIPIMHNFNVKPNNNKFNIYFLSDIHLGSPAFLRDEFERIAKVINNDPNAYTMLLGDLTDDDRPSTRAMRRQMFGDRIEAFQQEDLQHLEYMDKKIIPELSKIIKPGKCLGALDGDHYRRYSTGLTSVQYICAKLKMHYMSDGLCRIKLRFNYYTSLATYNILALHGVGGCGRKGNGVNKLEDLANGYEGFDCFVRGHNHQAFIHPTSRYYEKGNGEMSQKDIWLINSPSFRTGIIDGETDYAEKRCYPASAHKFPVLHLSIVRDGSSMASRAPRVEASGELI